VTDHLKKLTKRLQYQFNDPGLLRQALTHRSVGANNNERLEFLGDAVLNLVIAYALYQFFPQASEGDLSRLRAHLVKGETLAELAQELTLGDYLVLGPGELKSGGFRRDSILAGALEAVFGAIYTDGDFGAVRDQILAIYFDRLESASLENIGKDPKTQLQEYLQARRLDLPNYSVVAVEGKDHKQIFRVSCEASCLGEPVQGSGRSRRRAEQDAAARTLELLDKNNA
jgi:ribonuclease-3